MTPLTTHPPIAFSTFFVLGLGQSGMAAAHHLRHSGKTVYVWDDHEATRHQATLQGLTVRQPEDILWSEISALLLSPGIAHTHPAPHPCVVLAKAAGVPLSSDVDLFFGNPTPARVVGITGTNGKSTTTALIHHLLSAGEISTALGGNFGIPALHLPALPPDGVYVLELSSYQLDITPALDLDIAILLNITPDHLERHGGMAGYVASKKRVFHNASKPTQAIINIDDPLCHQIAQQLTHAGVFVLPISVNQALESGVYVKDGILYDTLSPQEARPTPPAGYDLRAFPSLKGPHNHQNAAASYAALRLLGMAPEKIIQGLSTFAGLPHRQEPIQCPPGPLCINDSKATNAEATLHALRAYADFSIYWIAGGRPKESGIAILKPYFPSIAHAFLIGEAAPDFGAFLTLEGIPVTNAGTLDTAVALAHHVLAQESSRQASRPAVILFSPACASFDQFRNFQERGDHFRKLVMGQPLPESPPQPVQSA